MSAIRLPLLCAFAGGCLSNALLFGIWRVTESASAPAAPPHRSHNVELVATAAVTAMPSVEPASEPVSRALAHAPDAPSEPASAETAQDADGVAPAPTGSAVSDVLMNLEAAYRERVAQAPAPTRTSERAIAADAIAAPEAPPPPPAAPPPDVVPPPPPAAAVAMEPRAVAPASIAPPVAPPAPPSVPPSAAPDFVPPPPPFAAANLPPTEIHYGDVNQNTYITNVRQGDVYLVQMQQLAMLQYLQMMGMSSRMAGPARRVAAGGSQRVPFPSGITNPDNPWGFHFAPPNLVR